MMDRRRFQALVKAGAYLIISGSPATRDDLCILRNEETRGCRFVTADGVDEMAEERLIACQRSVDDAVWLRMEVTHARLIKAKIASPIDLRRAVVEEGASSASGRG